MAVVQSISFVVSLPNLSKTHQNYQNPIFYPKIAPTDGQLYDDNKQVEPEPKDTLEDDPDYIPEKCKINGKEYRLGYKLFVDRMDTHHGRTCASCTCQVPPLFTCKADFRCNGMN